jgi:hypothetical protein
MYLLIYWLRSLYNNHYDDAAISAAPTVVNVSFTTTANSKNVTSVVRTDTSAAYQIPIGSVVYTSTGLWVPISGGQDGSSNYRAAVVTVSASGTATLDRAAQTSTTYIGTASQSSYHFNRAITSPFAYNNATTTPEVSADQVTGTVIGTDLLSWMDLATGFFSAFAQHFQRDSLHAQAFGNFGNIWWANLGGGIPYPNLINPKVVTASYALFFSQDYKTENGIEYLTLGNPILSPSTNIANSLPVGYTDPAQINYTSSLNTNATGLSGSNALYQNLATRTNTLSNLPVLTNNVNTNYDLANIKLQIYRTLDGGTTYFKVGEVANGTTSFVDNVNDSVAQSGETALEDNEPIYTAGGVVGHDQPPQCKFVHILNGTAYYGAITDADQFLPNRILQSVQNSPDAAPLTFFDDLDDDLTGISSTRNNVIAFCKTSLYRMEGSFNELGQGALTHEKISDTVGGLNASSIVQTEIGVFFAGTDGFYYTDGYQIIKISLEIDKTYQAFTSDSSQARCLYGTYDKANRRIYWCVKNSPTSEDNSMVYIYYLNFGVKPSGVFTTIRNGLNFQPSSMAFHNGVGYIGDARGYILKMDPWNKYDAIINITQAPSLWTNQYVPYNYTSLAVSMGTIFNRKWITKMHIVGENTGNMAIQPYALRDLNQTGQGPVELAPINYNENIRWGTPICIWGDSEQVWKTDGKMDLWRRFPRTTLRSDFMQIELKPRDGAVYASSQEYPEFAYAVTSHLGGSTSQAVLISPQKRLGFYPNGGSQADSLDGNHQKIAVEFDNFEDITINLARFWLKRSTAFAPSGKIYVEIYSHSAGLPNTLLQTSNQIDASSVGAAFAPFTFYLTPFTMLAGVKYWFAVTGDATFQAAAPTAGVGYEGNFLGGGGTSAAFWNTFAWSLNPNYTPKFELLYGYYDIQWPKDVVGYSLKTGAEDYANEYEITALSADGKTITVTDTAQSLSVVTSPGTPWEIWGVKKEQRPTITSFVIHYNYLGDKNQAYPGAFTNSGAGNGGENPS